jgi:hypothetical protein
LNLEPKKEVLFEDPLERGEWRESGKALLGVVPQSGTDQWEKSRAIELRDGHFMRPLLLLCIVHLPDQIARLPPIIRDKC